MTYLKECRRLVEERLSWPVSSKDWRQRDYLNLIAALEDKTGIALSLSTVKRIWSDKYTGNPHPATLDALAKFAGFEDWLSFQQSQRERMMPRETDVGPIIVRPSRFWRLPLLLVAILGGSLVLLLGGETGEERVTTDKEAVVFTVDNTRPTGVPNTVIFRFDLSQIEADSFFIQQSWDPTNRASVAQTDTVLTSIYYHPGVHTAKIIANETVVKETTLRIHSGGWIAAAYVGKTDFVPTYLPLEVVDDKTRIYLPEEQLATYGLAVENDLAVNYYYVDDFRSLSGDDFTLSVTFRVDSLFPLTCPMMGIMVIGAEETHGLRLTDKGCIHQGQLKFGEKILSGRNTDLSKLAMNPFEEQQLTINVSDGQVKILRQDQLLLSTAYTEDIGEFVGLCFSFSGTGAVHAVELTDGAKDKLFYRH